MEDKLQEEERKAQEEYEKIENEIKELVKDKNIDKMTAIELREIAKKIPGVTGVHAMKKEKVLDVVKDFLGLKEKKAPKQGKESISDLKKKIAQLKEKRQQALKSKDKSTAAILRRKISRLKKLTRKLAKAV